MRISFRNVKKCLTEIDKTQINSCDNETIDKLLKWYEQSKPKKNRNLNAIEIHEMLKMLYQFKHAYSFSTAIQSWLGLEGDLHVYQQLLTPSVVAYLQGLQRFPVGCSSNASQSFINQLYYFHTANVGIDFSYLKKHPLLARIPLTDERLEILKPILFHPDLDYYLRAILTLNSLNHKLVNDNIHSILHAKCIKRTALAFENIKLTNFKKITQYMVDKLITDPNGDVVAAYNELREETRPEDQFDISVSVAPLLYLQVLNEYKNEYFSNDQKEYLRKSHMPLELARAYKYLDATHSVPYVTDINKYLANLKDPYSFAKIVVRAYSVHIHLSSEAIEELYKNARLAETHQVSKLGYFSPDKTTPGDATKVYTRLTWQN